MDINVPGEMTWNIIYDKPGLYLRQHDGFGWQWWESTGLKETTKAPFQVSSGYGLFLDLIDKGWKVVKNPNPNY